MNDALEIYAYDGPGYRPLLRCQDWMVALLNYEPIMALEHAREIERHTQTDEVFILLQGQAVFYLVTGDRPLQVVEMAPGRVYNVTAGTWHNLLATPDARFVIVEKRDTDLHDTQIRPLTSEEAQQLAAVAPDWAKID